MTYLGVCQSGSATSLVKFNAAQNFQKTTQKVRHFDHSKNFSSYISFSKNTKGMFDPLAHSINCLLSHPMLAKINAPFWQLTKTTMALKLIKNVRAGHTAFRAQLFSALTE